VESTVRMGFPPGITSSGTRNPPEVREFHRELPAYLLGFRLVRSKLAENPLNGNNARIRRFKSYLLTIQTFFQFKYDGLFQMKNKPDPVLLGTSYLSKLIKKRTPKSRETIPIRNDYKARTCTKRKFWSKGLCKNPSLLN
jgi:hypothetical protein